MPGLIESSNMEHMSLQDRRQRRLEHLGTEWGLDMSPLPSPPVRPGHPPSVATQNDYAFAEDLLRHQRAAEQAQQTKGGLSRAFTTKKKTWEYKEIYSALVNHVANRGPPGVAEALVNMLSQVGGNVNLAQKTTRPSLLSRRKSLDLAERSQVLQKAVANRHKEMVQVLLPFADALSLDTALPIAMRNQDFEIVEMLIQYGANAAHTAEGQDAFRAACGTGNQAEMIAMILSSDGRPDETWISQSMVEAARAGCLDTVLALSQSTADGNYDAAAALKAAVSLGRRDIALALILGCKPPGQIGLNEAFDQLMAHQNITPNEKLAMVEVLLCAGAGGDPVARALVQASATDFIEMVHMLVSYGASIDHQDARALRKAVSAGRVDLVDIMLSGDTQLSPIHASEAVSLMPQQIRFEDRYALLKLLLQKGAAGLPLDEALINVTELGDVEAAKLLLTPIFPGGKIVGNKDLKRGPRSMVFEGHAVASTDHKGGLALQLAVKNRIIPIAKLILTAEKRPSNEAMAEVYPSVRTLPRLERYQMTEAFLAAGLSGPCVHSALQNAIDETPPHRDERLIALLLRSNADVNFNEGAGITAAIAQKDVSLLHRLLKSNPTPQIAAKALPRAMEVQDPVKRGQMVGMLIDAGASQGGPEISTALATLLQSTSVDKNLVVTLMQRGRADINANNGSALVYAVQSTDPELLQMVLDLSQPTQETLHIAMIALGRFASIPTKAEKLDMLLKRVSSKDSLSQLLIDEVQSVLRTPPSQRVLSVLKTLLANGANVNAKDGEALQRAVGAANGPMVDLLFSAKPNPRALAWAMPHALRIKDAMDRIAFAQKIIQGGIASSEVNRALMFAVQTYPDDIPLINLLLSHADAKDGVALIKAIEMEKQDIVDLILNKKKRSFSVDILNKAFTHATKARDQRARSMSASSLLQAGASGEVVSDALLAAATDGDLDFGTILVRNGGSVEHKDGQAIIEACRSGSADVLGMLLSGDVNISQQTLQKGFQAATEISDLAVRAAILKLLLQHGVTGDVVDMQLVSAERFGDNGSNLVRLLLVYGASPDYNEGEAIVKATKSAFLDNLKMLLCIEEVGGKQKKPSSHTLLRAMDACWSLSRDTRFLVLEWIFQAGKPVPNAVHLALTKAVNEENPEERIIQLLVANRASPTANGCQTLIDATRTLSASQFSQLLESKITPEEASLAFGKAFVPAHAQSWLSDRGLEIARCLLRKGASGDAVGSALVAVLGAHAESPGDIADNFVELLLKYDADINYNHGEGLRNVASQGNPVLLRRLLQEKPNSESLTLAFPQVFDAHAREDEVLELVELFVEYHDDGNQIDTMFADPESEPVIIRALSQFPRSTKLLQALLDIGYYHDQMTSARVLPEIDEEEQVNLITWTLLQPQKKISTGVIEMLIDRGAKVNYETRLSRISPLMLAIQTRRPDLVKSLLLAGAEVDVCDAMGRSPLSMASAIGGDLAISMMSNLLAAGASRNDGSLHNAARELNLQAMQILMEYKHDPDFPSPSPEHNGRSALGELCLHAADSGEITAMREKAMEKCINFLLQESDITIQSEGKSVLLLALESKDPITTTKVLLRADMWKFINKPFNQFTDGKYTYSPTQYVSRVLPQTDATPELLKLLKANRGADVYYATSGDQPEDAVGMPVFLQDQEAERQARLQRQRREDEEHLLAINRSKELAAVQAQIWANQAELEDARRKRSHQSDLSAIQDKARLEDELFARTLAQQRAKQSAEVSHQQALTEASRRRVQELGDAELAHETQKQQRMLEWERDLGNERVGNANQLSSIRLREREETERMDFAADERFQKRIKEQKRLVDSQSHLAASLGGGPNARRQIPGPSGYITGEVQ
ncbi:hypothetical protein PFICI_04792 [Pestalotiopsis fici W106-1]|uniref:Ankyrin repeat containing protein n=1 Tax=Pestalotiopsis fici (strain W106-1 / CGMCC3.15140) TaxID=1229662 RepID=W3XCL1_PESFW|nr:uncharacterized protein PFICI_04792 [Pestalotiopsis fici W106-1]ETS82916.1 hypothetical protein PFICI_04792 [Pestalotiopsis fici W106-1]